MRSLGFVEREEKGSKVFRMVFGRLAFIFGIVYLVGVFFCEMFCLFLWFMKDFSLCFQIAVFRGLCIFFDSVVDRFPHSCRSRGFDGGGEW